MNLPVNLVDWAIYHSALAIEGFRTGVRCNPFGRSVRQDPYAIYSRLREKPSLHPSSLIDGFLASQYDDVSALLRDGRFTSDFRSSRLFNRRRTRRILDKCETSRFTAATPPMIRCDGDSHDRFRRVAFSSTKRLFSSEHSAWVEREAESLLKMGLGSSFDFISRVAEPLARSVASRLLGLPDADRPMLDRWLRGGLIATFGGQFLMSRNVGHGRRDANTVRAEMRTYFAALLQGTNLLNTGVVNDVRRALESSCLSRDEGIAVCEELLVAGFETSAQQLANCVRVLAQNEQIWSELRISPHLVPSAVEELCRFEPAIQGTSRIAKETIEWRGTTILPGQQVVALIGSANRDPRQFGDPDCCDIRRLPNRHLTFGIGGHSCPGSQVAKITLNRCIMALLGRYRRIQLLESDLKWVQDPVVRGTSALPITAT